ncbi:MAG: HAD hydrolase-like protein [bacterium]|jgi:phosphoglycolate phosphatase-like HAD superfamily hydrolase
MEGIRVLILDFDGTVADTMSYLTDLAAGLLVGRYGMAPEGARRAYVETTGLPFVQQMEILYPGDARNAETVRLFETEKRESMHRFDLFPDVMPVIAAIREGGAKVCVSSGNYEDLILDFMEKRGLEVDLVMGFRPGFEKGRDHFEHAMRRFGSGPEATVFVGDSIKDGERARDCGIAFIGRTGLVAEEAFREAFGQIPVVSALEDLLHILKLAGPAPPAPGEDATNPEEGQRPSG